MKTVGTKISSFVLTLTLVQQVIKICYGYSSPTFDHICSEENLYRPYVRIHRGIKGNEIFRTDEDVSSGLWKTIDESNIYVCINGPVYLYFTQTTELGVVYETPTPFQRVHYCQTFNVIPRPGATISQLNETLTGILLIGGFGEDRPDYRKPALQLFTAPYYNSVTRLYENATSLVTIGTRTCYIEKNGQIIEVLHPEVPKPNKLCRLGYNTILDANSTTPILDNAKQIVAALRNNFGLRNVGCDAVVAYRKVIDAAEKNLKKLKEDTATVAARVTKSYTSCVKELNKSTKECDDIKTKCLTAPPNAPTDWTTASCESKLGLVEKQDAQKILVVKSETLKAADDSIKLIREEILQSSTTQAFEDFKTEAGEAIDDKESEINTITEKIEFEEDKDIKLQLEEEINVVQKALSQEVNTAKEKFNGILTNVFEGLAEIMRYEYYANSLYHPKDDGLTPDTDKPFEDFAAVKIQVDLEVKDIPAYMPTEAHTKIQLRETNCLDEDHLPHFETQCKRGKPSPERVCDLTTTVLGTTKPSWTTKAMEAADAADPAINPKRIADEWKDEIIDLVEDIFSTACSNVDKKFARNVNSVMKTYLTDSEIFNKRSVLPPINNSALAPVSPNANKKQRDFWLHIKEALIECKRIAEPIQFEEGTYDIVYVNEDAFKLVYFKEQAEEENIFNFVIDMHFKMFGTVMGLCMPAYEVRYPLITSKFYSMYTEDFFIPLRETWVKVKDNFVFELLLGKYYTDETEMWCKSCMEASFVQSDKVLFRPLRSLLVNAGTEHNYFICGKDFTENEC